MIAESRGYRGRIINRRDGHAQGVGRTGITGTIADLEIQACQITAIGIVGRGIAQNSGVEIRLAEGLVQRDRCPGAAVVVIQGSRGRQAGDFYPGQWRPLGIGVAAKIIRAEDNGSVFRGGERVVATGRGGVDRQCQIIAVPTVVIHHEYRCPHGNKAALWYGDAAHGQLSDNRITAIVVDQGERVAGAGDVAAQVEGQHGIVDSHRALDLNLIVLGADGRTVDLYGENAARIDGQTVVERQHAGAVTRCQNTARLYRHRTAAACRTDTAVTAQGRAAGHRDTGCIGQRAGHQHAAAADRRGARIGLGTAQREDTAASFTERATAGNDGGKTAVDRLVDDQGGIVANGIAIERGGGCGQGTG